MAAGCATGGGVAANVAPMLNQRLQPLARFVGNWRGTGAGEPGASAVERSYAPVLGGRFIEVRNRSTYAPQPANPKGEVHDDVGYLSFDGARKLFVLRQFHIEGFFNQYAATTADFTDGKLVFASEALENIPASFKARETYVFSSADAFEEIFEIAEDGAKFEVYSHNMLTRA
ncbi:MAG: hypothetical protein Q8R02_22080 [Hyphomonadaceae bacterium]|nr:hypothetical protein [Hyphomonadaceae bacterium]